MNRTWTVLVVAAAGVASFGCGGSGGQNPQENVKQQSQGKLEAMKQLADAIEKKDQQQVSGCIEAIISNNMDAKAYPDAAKELVDVYNKRVKGKLKGDEATQVKSVVDEVEKQLK